MSLLSLQSKVRSFLAVFTKSDTAGEFINNGRNIPSNKHSKEETIMPLRPQTVPFVPEGTARIDLPGPSHLDRQWQSRHNRSFARKISLINWHQKKAVCPAGKTSSSWSDATTETAKHVVKIKFSTIDCQNCSLRFDCAKSKTVRRALTILPEVQYERGAEDSLKGENGRISKGISKAISTAFRD